MDVLLIPSCFSLIKRSIPRLLVTASHTRRDLFLLRTAILLFAHQAEALAYQKVFVIWHRHGKQIMPSFLM